MHSFMFDPQVVRTVNLEFTKVQGHIMHQIPILNKVGLKKDKKQHKLKLTFMIRIKLETVFELYLYHIVNL